MICQPIYNALNERYQGTGAQAALKGERANQERLANCGFDTQLQTSDEALIQMLEKIVARWNVTIMPLNSQINKRPASKDGGGKAFQAIPMSDERECQSKLVFSEADYAIAALIPVCPRDFVYIDKFRQQGLKQDKMLDDFVLQTIKR